MREISAYLLCLPSPIREFVQSILVLDPSLDPGKRPNMDEVFQGWSATMARVKSDHRSWKEMMSTVDHPHRLYNRSTNPSGDITEWKKWMVDQRLLWDAEQLTL